MYDTDSFLLKCTLEAMAEGVHTSSILEECECRMGMKSRDTDVNNNY